MSSLGQVTLLSRRFLGECRLMHTKAIVIGVFSAMTLPAFGDGIPTIASWAFTGGPLAPYLASSWGFYKSFQLGTMNRCLCACLLSIPLGIYGYQIGFDIGMSSNWFVNSGFGIFFGPFALSCGLLAGRLPSFLLSIRSKGGTDIQDPIEQN